MEYGILTKILHWLLAVLIILMLLVGVAMIYTTHSLWQKNLFMFHKSLGLTILVLMILRLLWRINNVAPGLPAHVRKWQRIVAHASHKLFYFLLILMPLDGWILSMSAGHPPSFFGLFMVPSFVPINKNVMRVAAIVHEALAWAILGLLIVHVLAAIKHHFIDKDDILKRMLITRRWQKS